MTVYRTTPLPVAQNRGRLIVPEFIARVTLKALRDSRGLDGRHEGLVYWAGRRVDADAIVLMNFVPRCEHGPQRVIAPPEEIGRVNSSARLHALVVVAQVHSHPGDDTRHSDGDDRLIPMPYEGMFSVVVARYGDGALVLPDGVGLHQYQDRRWVQIPTQCSDAISILPTSI
jgi:proteasome lid subunit RPN8/RPN11